MVRFIDAEQVVLRSDYREYMMEMGTPGFLCGSYSCENKDLYSFLCILFYHENPNVYNELKGETLNKSDIESRASFKDKIIKDMQCFLGETEEKFFSRNYKDKLKILEDVIGNMNGSK
ncbi:MULTISPECIES: hypothetical protein [unclassified Granulicatella]|uniref:hypothetical protein n=1 Tax=unclassified Granulicatella TaxID=2630493 RepID=UPI00107386F3|nr:MULTISPECIES: hypothetical protein [unclassified Granulicatella]MBF0780641.1 hypothetical protein [Granulicatella sp. 19428wC4_WM01]TFU94570.1 hypothetical protein E4T68_05985 [Granulicatella sp. WM01]